MGFKKSLGQYLLKSLFETTLKDNPNTKRIIKYLAVGVTIFTFVSITMLGFGAYKISQNLYTITSEYAQDSKLNLTKKDMIVVTDLQKQEINSLITQLKNPEITEAEKALLEKRLAKILENNQVKQENDQFKFFINNAEIYLTEGWQLVKKLIN